MRSPIRLNLQTALNKLPTFLFHLCHLSLRLLMRRQLLPMLHLSIAGPLMEMEHLLSRINQMLWLVVESCTRFRSSIDLSLQCFCPQ